MGEFYMRIEYGDVKKEIRAKYTEDNIREGIHKFLESGEVLGKLNAIGLKMGPCATRVYIKLKFLDFELKGIKETYLNTLLRDFMFIDELTIETERSEQTHLILSINQIHINTINILDVNGDVRVNVPSIHKGINIRNDDYCLPQKYVYINVIVDDVIINADSYSSSHCFLQLYSLRIGALLTNLSTALDECVMDWKNEDNSLAIRELRFTHCPLYYIPNLIRNSGIPNFIENKIGCFFGKGRESTVNYWLLKEHIKSLRNAYTALLPLFLIAPGAAMDILKNYSPMFSIDPINLDSELRIPIHENPDHDLCDYMQIEIMGRDKVVPCYGFGFQDLKI